MAKIPRDEAICGHLGIARTGLIAGGHLGTAAMAKRIKAVMDDTLWRGDIVGTEKMLCGLIAGLGKLKQPQLKKPQLAAASNAPAAPLKASKLQLLPGVEEAIAQIKKAFTDIE